MTFESQQKKSQNDHKNGGIDSTDHVLDAVGSKMREKFRVTIEPALFAGLMSVVLVYLTSQNLILDKACRANLNYSGTYRMSHITFGSISIGIRLVIWNHRT
jgi:hypothetical protein